jgi:Protein of unknown function (DUF3768)
MDKTDRIRTLNDVFRRAACGPRLVTGEIVATAGVLAQGEDFLARAVIAVRSFNNFTEDNDPYGQHDFGSFMIDDQKLFWKIDHYDLDLKYGADDPADPDNSCRVLTILLASEY